VFGAGRLRIIWDITRSMGSCCIDEGREGKRGVDDADEEVATYLVLILGHATTYDGF
jgi:hypothetical protein